MNLFKNFAMHNIIGHPVMHILNTVGLHDLATIVHDATLPIHEKFTNSDFIISNLETKNT